MPRYDFQCGECKAIVEDQFLRITHLPDEIPHHCDEPMNYYITQPPLVQWVDPVIEPFRNPAAVRGDKDDVILTSRQRKEFMARNDLVDANDVMEGKPPSHQEQKEAVAEMKKDIAAISPDAGQIKQMEKSGALDPQL